MDLSKLKLVGHMPENHEPIYEINSIPHREERETDCADYMNCLPCLINALIDPAENIEVYLSLAKVQFDGASNEERKKIRRSMAVASEALVNLKAIITLAARTLQ